MRTSDRSISRPCSARVSQTLEPPWYGPVCPVVGEGRRREAPPYPDHSASYWRKPRGRPCRLGREHDRRFSFCCAVDGCRTRTTPPSLRFLGRKVYLAAIVVLIAILRHGATARRHAAAFRVDRRRPPHRRALAGRGGATPSRRARSGRSARAAFMPPVDQDRLPASLIERFTGGGGERLIALLRFIGPITGGDRHAR